MVGEMGFLEEQTRTADVRATDGAVCQRWDRGSLLRVLEGDPTFAAAFYKALAGFAVDRSRSITATAMTGALGGARGAESEPAGIAARTLSVALCKELASLEPRIRTDRAATAEKVKSALHNFAAQVESLFGRVPDAEQDQAGQTLATDLQPYLMRSQLGELASVQAESGSIDPAVLAHICAHRPTGDGPLGEMIDQWLLDLPTSRGIRERRAYAAEIIPDNLPDTPPLRFLAIGAASATLLGPQLAALGRMGGKITCVEGNVPAVEFAQAALKARPRTLQFEAARDEVVSFCVGRPGERHRHQHLVLIDSVLEYLPEAVAVQCLRTAGATLGPQGRIVVTAMAPSADRLIYHFLLRWPMIRRSKLGLQSLLEGAGFTQVRAYDAGGAGLAAVALRA
jgi:hypothetical protein